MEETSRRVSDLPIGVNDVISGFEALLHIHCDVGKDLCKERLISLAEDQRITVAGETVDEVLREIGPPRHPELAEKGQSPGIQPEYYIRPYPSGRLTCGVSLFALLYELPGFLQDFLLSGLREVLENRHMIHKPLVRWVKELAIWGLPLSGYGNELIKGLLKLRVDWRRRER